jgi:hypothetical protein
MNMNRDMRLMKEQDELMDSIAVSVKISYGESLKVVVNSLIAKYKSCVECNDTKKIEAFGIVLRCYLTEEEFDKMV